MIAQARRSARHVSAWFHESGSHCPATTQANKPMTPNNDTAFTPNRPLRRAKPMTIASGIVLAMVNKPHGLCERALTTTNPSTARMMVMMASRLTMAMKPTTGLISSRSIWPSDLPSRRNDAKRTTASCTPPPRVAPTRIQSRPGR